MIVLFILRFPSFVSSELVCIPTCSLDRMPIEHHTTFKSGYNITNTCSLQNISTANQAIGKAFCTGDLISQSSWEPEDNCGPVRNITELLEEISEVCVELMSSHP